MVRWALAALAVFAAGLLAGHALFGRAAPSPRADQPPPAAITEPAPAGAPAVLSQAPAAAPPGDEREQWQAEKRHLLEKISRQNARLHDLEREIEGLRRTLPAPAILDELGRATVKELLDVADALGRAAQEKLFTVPEEVRRRYASVLGLENAGAARILERGRYDRIVAARGGGAYFSFATRTNDYDKEPDLELQQGQYSTSFYGGTFGFLLDLGEYPLENIPTDVSAVPSGLTAEQEKAWRFLASEVSTVWQARRAWEQRGKALGLRDAAQAHPDHTYLLRAVLPGEHDILVAFRDAHRDETGSSIVWREIGRWPAPR
jgi:hypothetical protein